MKLLAIAALAALTLQAQTAAPAKADNAPASPSKQTKKVPQAKPEGSVQIDISLGELYAAQSSLAKLFSVDLPVKTAWGLRTNATSIDAKLKSFSEQLADLRKKHGIKDGDTSITPEHMKAFNADVAALADIRVALTIIPVSLAMLGDTVKLSVGDMARLEAFLAPE